MEQSTKDTYPAGTVAVATVRGVEGVRVFCDGDRYWRHPETNGFIASPPDAVAEVRPLVVLDIANAAHAVDALRATMPCDERDRDAQDDLVEQIADQIEAQTKPRKPAEPNGVGAVVEDSRGDHWVRLGYGPAAWIFAASSPGNRDTYSYSSIDAVKVLSEGAVA